MEKAWNKGILKGVDVKMGKFLFKKYWQSYKKYVNIINVNEIIYADVAKLADALDLGSSVFDVGVQVLSSAPKL